MKAKKTAAIISIQYAPTFVRMYKRLEDNLKEEIKEKIAFFQDSTNHEKLKVHKLKGSLENTYSFSVNYKIRIVFEYEQKDIVNLLYVGSHDETY
jgi:addiction module RelE/StbE family toxin